MAARNVDIDNSFFPFSLVVATESETSYRGWYRLPSAVSDWWSCAALNQGFADFCT